MNRFDNHLAMCDKSTYNYSVIYPKDPDIGSNCCPRHIQCWTFSVHIGMPMGILIKKMKCQDSKLKMDEDD